MTPASKKNFLLNNLNKNTVSTKKLNNPDNSDLIGEFQQDYSKSDDSNPNSFQRKSDLLYHNKNAQTNKKSNSNTSTAYL